MSRLIDIDPQMQPEPETEGYELSYYTFDSLPTLEVTNVETTQNISLETKDKDAPNNDFWKLPINNDTLSRLQQEDVFCKNILSQIEKGNIVEGQILRMAHDELGHNGTHRTYTLLKRLYYWKGLKPSVEKHIKMCYQCQRRDKQVVKYATLHFNVATFPMQFIFIDLIGKFHPPTSRKYRYALTVICMLTGYVFCVPLKTKAAKQVIQAYIDHVYAKFGGSLKMLSDNSTEFKNKVFEQVAKELGLEYKLYTLPYHPASNGRIEGFHAFLKACIAKHVVPQLEWNVLVPLACAAYNFIPNEHSKESTFFVMFGRDPILPLNT